MYLFVHLLVLKQETIIIYRVIPENLPQEWFCYKGLLCIWVPSFKSSEVNSVSAKSEFGLKLLKIVYSFECLVVCRPSPPRPGQWRSTIIRSDHA